MKSHWVAMTILLTAVTCGADQCLAEDSAAARLDQLAASAKLIDPQQVLAAFEEGRETTRVIVNLQVPARFQEGRAMKNKALQNERARTVREMQDQVVGAVQKDQVKITNRFRYVFGFSAEVTPAGLQSLLNSPEVVSVNKDEILYPHLSQGIPLLHTQTVRSTHDGSGLAIAICDTGIDVRHPMLGHTSTFPNAKVIGGWDCGDDDADPRPDPVLGHPHGTSCAGIAAGDIGFAGDYIGGVAPGARLYALKISYGNQGSAYDSDMIEAWEWCITHQYDDPANPIMIISTSFGGGQFVSYCDQEVPARTAAAANAVALGMTLFVSAGNDGFTDSIESPACISHVMSVGAVYDADVGYHGYSVCIDATTAPDQVTCYSNSADFLTLFAASHDAYTLDIVGGGGSSAGDYVTNFGGTSAACPYAAGAAAVLQGLAKARTGGFLSPGDLRALLTTRGDLVTDPKAPAVTKPRVNLDAAVAAIQDVKSFTIFNQGINNLDITAMTKQDDDPWFTFSPQAPFSIQPGGSRVVAVEVDWNLVPGPGDDDRILVASNDVDENPYPDGVYINAEPASIDPPVIDTLTFASCIADGCFSPICITAHDPAGGSLTYAWTPLNGGSVIGAGNYVEFHPPGPSLPPACDGFWVEVEVASEASGLSTTDIVEVKVKAGGDANGDGWVNSLDQIQVRDHFGASGNPGWIGADLNCDGWINSLDQIEIRNHFGSQGCPCQ